MTQLIEIREEVKPTRRKIKATADLETNLFKHEFSKYLSPLNAQVGYSVDDKKVYAYFHEKPDEYTLEKLKDTASEYGWEFSYALIKMR